MADLEAVLAVTEQYWDTSGKLPVPRGEWLQCPVCQTAEPRIRFWRYHTREKSETTPYRCDVSFKCVGCAFVWLHGVVVSEEHWARRPLPNKDKTCIDWRVGRKWVR
jgi:hypothetical protein